jgi:hypothetical protein
MISQRQPFRMLFESHEKGDGVSTIEKRLLEEGIESIRANSTGRLSKYYTGDFSKGEPIFVIDRENVHSKQASRIEETTEIFDKYKEARTIERIYVSRKDYSLGQKIIEEMRKGGP